MVEDDLGYFFVTTGLQPNCSVHLFLEAIGQAPQTELTSYTVSSPKPLTPLKPGCWSPKASALGLPLQELTPTRHLGFINLRGIASLVLQQHAHQPQP